MTRNVTCGNCSPTRTEDELSLLVGKDERHEVLSDDESLTDSNITDEPLSQSTKYVLVYLFGDDSKSDKKKGIGLETCQKELLDKIVH
ncbi:hypothetical protein DPMN_147831 [Dreissena polymorpha]|uniref:Uncharacterized protein n=1 Tax=Dreissena polymorpha TaxID=45954 RepID=A0A9D4J0Z3_DREPO|nr:hypothetical protein DPMN_147831 [Dreissena polymorpha]